MIYQLMFALITPALITGAFAERVKFSTMPDFTALWTSAVYLPPAHMVWGREGFLDAAALGRGAAEWVRTGRPTVLGAISGAVAGSATTTRSTSSACTARAGRRERFSPASSPRAPSTPSSRTQSGAALAVGLLDGNGARMLNRLIGVGLTAAVACAASFVILKSVDLFVGLRVSAEREARGLDRSLHGEGAYDLGAEPSFAPAPASGLSAGFADFGAGYAGEVALEGAAGD